MNVWGAVLSTFTKSLPFLLLGLTSLFAESESLRLRYWKSTSEIFGKQTSKVVVPVGHNQRSLGYQSPNKKGLELSIPQIFDQLHAGIGLHYVNSAQWFDQFFGNTDDIEYKNHSSIRLRTGFQWNSFDKKWEPTLRLRSHFDLPYFEDRLNLIVESASEKVFDSRIEGDEDSFDSIQQEEEGTQSVGAALRYFFIKTPQQYLNIDIGGKLRIPVEIHIKGDYERRFELRNDWTFTFKEHLFAVYNGISGSSTDLTFRRPLSKRRSYRISQGFDFTEDSNGLEFDHTHSIYHLIRKGEAISYYIGVAGDSEPRFEHNRFGYGVQYRKSFFRPWLQLIFDPGIQHHRDRNWDAVYSLNIGLEAVFGNPK
jgi:hypothetical protein